MIPRAAHRLETTLLSSRQGLPRPARLYSTPSHRANAPALATAQIPRPDYPAFLSPTDGRSQNAFVTDLEGFLKRRAPYTILPTPLPSDRASEENSLWYTDSQTQDLLAVTEACLHNLYDVPRAKSIFDRLRNKPGNPNLTTHVYNAFLEAYINTATTRDIDDREFWIENASELYLSMESGEEQAVPNAGTYALMLIAWHR